MSDADVIVGLILTGISSGAHAPTLQWRRVGERYDDQRRALAQVLARGVEVDLCFAVPVEPKVDFVKLAAASVPGRYRVFGARAGGMDITDFVARIMGCDGARLDESAGSVVIENLQRIPSLELDVRGMDPGSLQIRVQREDRHAAGGSRPESDGALAKAQAEAESRMAAIQLSQASRLSGLARGMHAMHSMLEEGLRTESARIVAVLEQQASGLAQRLDSVSAAREAAESGRVDDMRQDLRQLTRLVDEIASAHRVQSERLDEHRLLLGRIVHGIENVFWRRWLARLRGVRK